MSSLLALEDEVRRAADEVRRKRNEARVAEVRSIATARSREEAPDRAEALQIEKTQGIPFDTAERNLPEIRAAEKARSLAGQAERSASTAVVLESPAGPLLAADPDQAEGIQTSTRGLWIPPPTAGEFVSHSWGRGVTQRDQSIRAGVTGILGWGSDADRMDLEDAILHPVAPLQKDIPGDPTKLLDDFLGEMVVQGPIMLGIGTYAASAAGMGAGIGAATTLGPGAGPGALIAAPAGVFTASWLMEGGFVWLELTRRAREIEERTGEVIDPGVIRGAAAIAGIASASLETMLVGYVARLVPGYGLLKRKLMGEAAEILLTNPGLQTRVKRFGKRLLKSAAAEASQEFGQELVQKLSVKATVAATTDEPFSWSFEDLTELLWAASVGGAVGPVYMSALGAPVAVANAVFEGQYAKERAAGLGAAVQASMGDLGMQLRETDPDLYREWQTRLIEEAGGDPNLYIDAKKINELFQSEDVDAEALAQALPEVLEQLPEALATGADVVIPIADYLTHLPEHHEALAQDVRFALTAPSVAEAEASEAALNETMQELAEVDQGGEELAPGEAVEAKFLKQLIESGAASPDVARQLSSLLRIFTERLSGRGVGEQAFEFGLDVEGPLADEVRPTLEQALERIDLNEMLNELRGGLEPELAGLPKNPLISILKAQGGVDPTGELAGELRNAGVTPKTQPGLFRHGGAGSLDAFDLSDTPYTAYMPKDDYGRPDITSLLDAILGEVRGDPVRSEEERERIRERRQPREELAAVLDQLGLDLDELTNEEVSASLLDRYGTATLEQAEATPHGVTGVLLDQVEDALQRAAPEDIEKENKRLEKLVGEFPGLATVLPLLSRSERAKVKKKNASRLIEVFEHFDPEELATVAYSGRAKRGWYRDSAQGILEVFGLEDAPRFAALLASMSPQTSIENNLINALNVWANWDKAGRPAGRKEPQKKGKDKWVSPEILEIMGASVQGEKGVKSVLDAWIQNSIRALSAETSEDMELDLTISGPKVNAFMLNLSNMVNEVTLDAWMANYGLMSQEMLSGTGMNVAETEPGKGSAYLAFSAVVRRAADVLTERTGELWTPAEVQETVWSWAKVLYEKASTAGEDRTAREILAAADLTAEEISDTPDFATLFAAGIYRKILEGAQLGEGIRDTQEGRGVPVAERGDEGPVTQAEGSGIAQDAFERHLATAADRLDALRADRERDRAANQGLALSEENLRGLGLLNEQGALGLPGDGAKPVPVEQLHKGARVPASAQRSIFRALGLAATKGQDTNESLRIYPLQTVFGETVEEVEAQLAQWLERVGWNYRVFGPHAGENGKAFYPDFSDPETPTYENSRTAWIYDPSESEGSFMDHAYTLAWRVTHEVAHGIANEQMTEKYGARGRRAGALGIIAKGPHRKPVAPLTLADGMRAVEWEHVTFLEQRRILEEDFGIEITDEEFLKENSVNLAGAVQRVLTGQFGDPGDLGVGAVALDSDVLLATAFDILKVASFQITGDIAQTFPEQESPVFGKKTGIELTDAYRKRRIALLKAQAAPTTLEQADAAPAARLVTSFSGAGTVEAVLGGAESVGASEFDPAIMAQYNEAHGTDYAPQDVADIDPADIAALNPDVYHASPVCKNFSKAKRLGTATDLDRKSAESVAAIITEAQPPVVTIENVPAYADTALFKLITDALDQAGYTWDVVIHDAADYGAAQSRKRMLLRAVKDGELPALPEKTAPGDWFAVIEDLIEAAPDASIPPVEMKRLREMEEGGKLDFEKPIITMGGSGFAGTWAASNAGGPSPTLKATPKEVPRIIMPDGRVKRVTPRMMARLMGLPDSYPVPEHHGLAKTVLGNGIHGETTRSLIQPLVDQSAITTLEQADVRAPWVRGERAENADGDLFFSLDQEIAENFGEVRPIAPEEYPGNPLRVSSKEELADVINYEGDPRAEALGVPPDQQFDTLAKRYAQEQGHDSILYEEGTFDAPELHVFQESIGALGQPAPLNWVFGPQRVLRGELTYDPELLDVVMRFTKAKNLSTGLHEMGHLFFLMMLRAVDQGTADESLVADMRLAMDYLGVESLEDIKTVAHEKWALSWEAYLYEGKAPSAELQSLFQRFRQWMIQVYKSIRKLDVELTPEIREVFDRMLATEEQIEGIQAQERMAPAFKAPHTGVMTTAEFQALQDAYGRSQAQANEQLLKSVMGELKRELTEQWKSDEKRMREQVETDINSQPVYQLRHYLQFRTLLNEDDPEGFVALRLDRKALVSKYGKSILKVLGGGSGQFSMWQAEGGLHPDALARMFGFDSGDALVRALADSQNRKLAIEQETDRRMKETYGDILNDGTITEMAQDALESDAKGNYLIRELRILSRASGKPDTPQAAAKQIASRLISGKRVRDLRPDIYRQAEARAAREMLRAVEAEDWEAAHAAGLQRLLNHFLIVEATKAKEKMERGRAYALTFDKKTTQQRIGKAGGGYLEEILSLLHRFDFRRMSDAEADRRQAKVIHSRPTLHEWISTLEANDPTAGVVIDQRLQDEGFATPWRNLRVDEFDAVIDAVKNIEHLARLKNKLLLAKDKRDLAARVEQVVETVSNNRRKKGEISKEPRLPEARSKNLTGHLFASHRKFTSLLNEMDGGPGGVLFDLIIRTMDERGTFETVEREKAWEALSEIFAPFSDYGSNVRRTLTAATLGKVPMFHGELESKGMVEGLGEELSLQGRIVAVLNMGNAGNKQRLKDGHDWSPEQMQAIVDSLTKEQFQFVQKLLTFIGSYRKMAFDKEQRVTGVRPTAVEATPITHSVHGEIPGGYFPIVGDPQQGDKQSLANAAKDAAQAHLRGAVVRATTRNGHLKERAEMVTGTKIRLDLGVVFEHVDNVIHNVAWHEWLIDTNKIMAHADVQDAILAGFGEPVYAQIRSALEDIAAGDVPAQKGWEQVVDHLRKGSSIAGMGWNVMTGAIQYIGLTQSMVRIGPKWVAKGISKWLRGAGAMEHTVRWIYDKSPMMANRATTMQREIREVQQKALRAGALDPVKDSYFFFIVKMQQVVDVPTWLGAYEKEMDASGDEARAVSMADRAVIDSQGGGQIQDLAKIQRGGPLMKLWTNFYSFFNTTLNLTAESYRRTDFKSPQEVGWFAVDMLLLHTLPLLLSKLMADAIRQSWDEDESWGEYIGWAHVAWFGNLFMGSRELTGAAEGYFGYSGPAGARGFDAMSSMFGQMAQGEADQALMRSTLQAMGIVLHLPAVEIQRAIEGGQALAEGTASSPHVLFTGPPKKK